jgi:hypothetical protein
VTFGIAEDESFDVGERRRITCSGYLSATLLYPRKWMPLQTQPYELSVELSLANLSNTTLGKLYCAQKDAHTGPGRD